MTKKELKRLSRVELIEMLILQTRRVERLQAELDVANAELARRQKAYDESGDLAEAALKLSGVFEAAQRAASATWRARPCPSAGKAPTAFSRATAACPRRCCSRILIRSPWATFSRSRCWTRCCPMRWTAF